MIPQVSIVLPFHNSERFLEKTLKSILDQTFANYELILVNDNSEDNSLNIIEYNEDDRIKIIPNEGSGAVDAYNTGIKHAAAELIFFADHDDIFDKNLMTKEYELLKEKKAVSIVSASFYVVDEKDRIIHSVELPSNNLEIKEKMTYQCSIVNSGSMIRKKIFDLVRVAFYGIDFYILETFLDIVP